jgi:hypothetical protein
MERNGSGVSALPAGPLDGAPSLARCIVLWCSRCAVRSGSVRVDPTGGSVRTRAFAFVVVASGALMVSQPVSAQVQYAAGVTIYDSINCPGTANSAKVKVPFSIGGHWPCPELVNRLLRDRQGRQP